MNKLLEILFPLILGGGVIFWLGYYAYTHQFDLLLLTIITLANTLVLGNLLYKQHNK